jgi:dienelactone hydrolase
MCFLRSVFSVLLSVTLFLFNNAMAEEGAPLFRVETIDADNEGAAAAAVDVDGDGKLDIMCGNYWYQAPDWTRRVAREVEVIRGRLDDYSNIPMDVDGDGRMDLVSCNYRSESIYWVKHPANPAGIWERTVLAKPGAMETGRAVDVDGDGKLDILPNGTKFAAWWSVAVGDSGPEWTRHDLPDEAAGHGIGFGDLDGDGHGDIVTPGGWFRAGQNARKDRWQPMPEFTLHRDAGLPILVHDFDGDGDADIAWGRGHQFGLYWLEQTKTGNQRHWVQHAIDTQISQAHSLLLADMDGDGILDLVTGRRFLGHDGKDLGEYDPLRVDGYSFQKESRTFRRFSISDHPRAAVGLDPKAADIDGDGDVDLLLADRSGLFLVRNLGRGAKPTADAAVPAVAHLGPPSTPSGLLDAVTADGLPRKIDNWSDWGRRRAAILAEMQRVMGDLPGPIRRVPLDVVVLETHEEANFTRQKITFQAEPGDRVPAYLFLPRGRSGKRPAMLCLHQTTGIGKGEPAGLGGKPELHYARELAERGYVCIVPDYPSFGDYQEYDFQSDQYVSGTMKAIWNNMRAVDYVESLAQVDPDRIGCIGHSLGGHNTLFTAAFDQRLKVAVTSCGFTAFHHYYGGKLAGWTSDRYMPRIRDQYSNDPDQMPFDFYGVLAAIAPRGIFVNAPLNDSNFDVQGVRKVVASVDEVYALFPKSSFPKASNMEVRYPDAGHGFPDEVRREAYDWMDGLLKP